MTDPFGASFSYTRDVQGRLKLVTGSPYAGTTSYVNDVTYRAWGAPKTVSYNGSTSTIGFNSRLQPTQFRLTANGNGASIIREDYSYFGDGRLNSLTDLDDTAGTNPPVSLRFLSRAYLYDHTGRVAFVYGTGNAGQGVPFNQTYLYDEFDNMTTRSGAYYNYNFSGPATDTATYTNDRRSNWTYNAEGQVISTPLTSTDRPRTMTYDAAGRMITSVENGQSSTVTYSASYDGGGQLIYETSNTSPGSTSASYIVRSTVLNGEVLTRLDQLGNKLITHVPSEGLLFATQRSSGGPGAYVNLTFRNPLGITETSKAVYDPLGNYIPFQASSDPRPPAGSYSSSSMSGLSSSQAEPNSFGVGCVMDGTPTNCNRVLRAIDRHQGKSLQVVGLALTPEWLRIALSITPTYGVRASKPNQAPPQPQPDPQPNNPLTPAGPTFRASLSAVEIWNETVIAPGLQRGFEQNPQNIGRQIVPLGNLQKGLEGLLKGDCGVFVQKLIDKANQLYGGGRPHATSFWDAFSRIQDAGGYQLADVSNGGTVGGELFVGELVNPSLPEGSQAGPGTVYMTPFGPIGRSAKPAEAALAQARYAYKALHETLHLAKRGWYYDEDLARAGHAADGTTAPEYGKDDILNWSKEFDNVLQRHCAYPFK